MGIPPNAYLCVLCCGSKLEFLCCKMSIANRVVVSFGFGSDGLLFLRIRHYNSVVSRLFKYWYAELLMFKWYNEQGKQGQRWRSWRRAIVLDASGHYARKRYSRHPWLNSLPEVGDRTMDFTLVISKLQRIEDSIRAEFPNMDPRGTPHVTRKFQLGRRLQPPSRDLGTNWGWLQSTWEFQNWLRWRTVEADCECVIP